MRKGIVLIMSMLILSIFLGCGIDRDKLVGEIVLSNPLSRNDVDGIVVYTPSKNEFKRIEIGICLSECGIVFNKDKSKILGVKFEKIKNSFVFEYDIANKKIIKVVDCDKLAKGPDSGDWIQYVPNTNNISYIANEKIYIYDRTKETNTALIDDAFGKYSWDKTGRKILYGDYNNKIYIYDLKTKERNQILEGMYPVLSNNNEYIAYMAKDRKLTIYEVNTKKEWKYEKLSGDENYIFSPDDKYIAIAGVQYYDIVNYPHFEMYVLDFKTGKKSKLFKGDGYTPGFDWK